MYVGYNQSFSELPDHPTTPPFIRQIDMWTAFHWHHHGSQTQSDRHPPARPLEGTGSTPAWLGSRARARTVSLYILGLAQKPLFPCHIFAVGERPSHVETSLNHVLKQPGVGCLSKLCQALVRNPPSHLSNSDVRPVGQYGKVVGEGQSGYGF